MLELNVVDDDKVCRKIGSIWNRVWRRGDNA